MRWWTQVLGVVIAIVGAALMGVVAWIAIVWIDLRAIFEALQPGQPPLWKPMVFGVSGIIVGTALLVCGMRLAAGRRRSSAS